VVITDDYRESMSKCWKLGTSNEEKAWILTWSQ